MADVHLTPRQLANLLQHVDDIQSHIRAVRERLVQAMADRRAEFPPGASRSASDRRQATPGDGAARTRKRNGSGRVP